MSASEKSSMQNIFMLTDIHKMLTVAGNIRTETHKTLTGAQKIHIDTHKILIGAQKIFTDTHQIRTCAPKTRVEANLRHPNRAAANL